ncbi:LysE family translocator [Bosea sp. (in: a-proteobacteria)]|uniref:LysE family translocator n=1 Tax=Bosea sp. (in: a-proteobacteria) TaxID=1871050 RepID=UPI0025B9EE98|nr:LysE family translocator [Bosea sp. (in: a-proteobacteria)]
MSIELYITFLAAATFLILTPGPNVSLIVGTSMAHGLGAGLLTVAGTTAATAAQLFLVVGGMASLLALAADAFDWIRWIGVAYLVWLGIAQWRAADRAEDAPAPVRFRSRLVGQGVLVALTNPKTLLFHAAFLPQFVSPEAPPGGQLLLLGVTYTVLAAALDCGWAWTGGRLRGGLSAARRRLVNRVSGVFLVCAGIGLALSRRP